LSSAARQEIRVGMTKCEVAPPCSVVADECRTELPRKTNLDRYEGKTHTIQIRLCVTHHSIMEWLGKWWLFYADTQLSNKNHLRNVKVTELHFEADGSIRTVDPYTS
jgi:hypothetical protein